LQSPLESDPESPAAGTRKRFLALKGVNVSYQTVRNWIQKYFGLMERCLVFLGLFMLYYNHLRWHQGLRIPGGEFGV